MIVSDVLPELRNGLLTGEQPGHRDYKSEDGFEPSHTRKMLPGSDCNLWGGPGSSKSGEREVLFGDTTSNRDHCFQAGDNSLSPSGRECRWERSAGPNRTVAASRH